MGVAKTTRRKMTLTYARVNRAFWSLRGAGLTKLRQTATIGG